MGQFYKLLRNHAKNWSTYCFSFSNYSIWKLYNFFIKFLALHFSFFRRVNISDNLDLQLNIQDAFQLCRYEWMREALEEFVRVMSEEQKVEITEEIVEPLPKPVPDVIAECQIVSSNCCVTTTSSQHHGISAIIPFHWQILKRLPLTWQLISVPQSYSVCSRL